MKLSTNQRNNLHYFIGGVLLFLIGWYREFHTWNFYDQLFGVPMFSIVVGAFVGWAWEIIQRDFLNQTERIDFKDIERTTIGALIGGVSSALFMY